MPLFLIERSFAEELVPTAESTALIRQINDEIGVQWIYSFLSADRRKTYCLYEAPSAEAIRVAARRAELPVDTIIEVSQLRPDMFGTIATTGTGVSPPPGPAMQREQQAVQQA